MYLRLAWRNIWRNKRRTIITASSVFVAVILAVVMRSLQLGSYQRMIDNVVSFYTGHIQIHGRGYWDEKTLEHSFIPDASVISVLNNMNSVSGFSPRLESFSLLSYKDLTKGSMITGIEPVSEKKITRLDEKIISGNYLNEKDNSVLVSEGLAVNLNLNTGDTIVLLGQGYHGATAAGKYPVCGIIKFPSPELNSSMVYMNLDESQKLFGTDNRLTSIAVLLKKNEDAEIIAEKLRENINSDNIEIKDWKDMLPEMLQIIEVDNVSGMITISVLYLIIAFGIFGTVLMMLSERNHEFGILVAVGMKKKLLAGIVILEIVMISGLGIAAGILAGIPVISAFQNNPIRLSGELATAYERFGLEPVFPFSDDFSIFINQAAVVFILTALISIYPWIRLLKLNTINALKS